MIYTIELSLYIRIGVTEFQVVMITGTAISDFNPSVNQRSPGQKTGSHVGIDQLS